MIDPDAPSRDDPEFADWLHWGVYNIPGDVFVHGALDVDEHAAHGFKLFDVFAGETCCLQNDEIVLRFGVI